MDNNSGNSNTNDRISLLKQCIKLLGAKRIGLVLGDRDEVLLSNSTVDGVWGNPEASGYKTVF